MTREEVLAAIADAVRVVLEVDGVTEQTRLVEDLRADSLAVVEVVEILEERLQVRLEDEMLDDLVTVGDAVDLVLASAR